MWKGQALHGNCCTVDWGDADVGVMRLNTYATAKMPLQFKDVLR